MLGGIIKSFLEIIYPRNCLICATSLKGKAHVDNLVCARCWSSIKKNRPPFCRSCGRQLAKVSLARHICTPCVRNKLLFDRAYSSCAYEGIIKTLIHEFKYKGKDYLGRPLSSLMTDFIKQYQLPIKDMDYIVPVPLHGTKVREREFNQAQILGQHIADEFDKILLSANLIRHRDTKSQTGLQNEDRFLNVRDSFSVKDKHELKNKNLLLVDDVLTTAATCSEAARTLKDAGANIVFVLTLAN